MSEDSTSSTATLERVRERLTVQAGAVQRAREEQKERETQDREPPVAVRWVRSHWQILFLAAFALLMICAGAYVYSQYRFYSGRSHRIDSEYLPPVDGSAHDASGESSAH